MAEESKRRGLNISACKRSGPKAIKEVLSKEPVREEALERSECKKKKCSEERVQQKKWKPKRERACKK